MIATQSTIDEAIKRLVKAYKPLKIYMYGDYVWGTPNEESTVDLFIIVDSSNERAIKRGYLAFEALLGLEIPKNVIVLTSEELNQDVQDPNSEIHEIVRKGKLIYARD